MASKFPTEKNGKFMRSWLPNLASNCDLNISFFRVVNVYSGYIKPMHYLARGTRNFLSTFFYKVGMRAFHGHAKRTFRACYVLPGHVVSLYKSTANNWIQNFNILSLKNTKIQWFSSLRSSTIHTYTPVYIRMIDDGSLTIIYLYIQFYLIRYRSKLGDTVLSSSHLSQWLGPWTINIQPTKLLCYIKSLPPPLFFNMNLF